MIVKKILELPAEFEYKGVVFCFNLFKNHSDELRICYEISYICEHSVFYKDYYDENSEMCGRWIDDTGHACNWLYLVENINSDEALVEAVDDCKKYLESIGAL